VTACASARNRIVVVIVRQAGDEADEPVGEDGAALAASREDDVALTRELTVPSTRSNSTASSSLRSQEGVGMVLRNEATMRRAAASPASHLRRRSPPGGAVAPGAKSPDVSSCDAVEQEGGRRRVAATAAVRPVVRRIVEAWE